jgi:hypothetical protein
MRTQIVAAAAAVLTVSALGIASAQTGQVLEKLAGVWTAEPLELRLNSDFDVSVWGPNASSIRKVEMTLKASGEGTITVTRSVVDGKGQTKPASVSIEEARLQLKGPETVDPNRIEPVVQVIKPERRYPDDPKDRTALDGLVVKIVATDLEHDRLNVRFDLADGRGSFGETLIRKKAAPRSTRKIS